MSEFPDGVAVLLDVGLPQAALVERLGDPSGNVTLDMVCMIENLSAVAGGVVMVLDAKVRQRTSNDECTYACFSHSVFCGDHVGRHLVPCCLKVLVLMVPPSPFLSLSCPQVMPKLVGFLTAKQGKKESEEKNAATEETKGNGRTEGKGPGTSAGMGEHSSTTWAWDRSVLVTS